MVCGQASAVRLARGPSRLLSDSQAKRRRPKSFAQLRELGQAVDLSLPSSRLAPIAERLGLPKDYARAQAEPRRFARAPLSRPRLTRALPLEACFGLAVETTRFHRQRLSLADYRGRPVVVVFYLGFGCLHCVEQLQAIAPKMDAFREAGLEIVAVSTESQSELAQALESYEKGGDSVPFPLVADPKLATFRAYRAYDDFEKVPSTEPSS